MYYRLESDLLISNSYTELISYNDNIKICRIGLAAFLTGLPNSIVDPLFEIKRLQPNSTYHVIASEIIQVSTQRPKISEKSSYSKFFETMLSEYLKIFTRQLFN